MAVKAASLWLVLLILAVLNGALRERLLIPALGPAGGLIVSGLLLAAAVMFLSIAALPWLGRPGARACWGIGIAWLAATLIFEIVFGRLYAHKTWPELLQAYTFEGGNLWSLVLLVIACAPRAAARIRGSIAGPRADA
jgi:hypothetical protein